jgi:tRNA nucleotidyltransferase (CCA-adding enzyme)
MSAVRQLKNTEAPLDAILDSVDGGDLMLFQVLRKWAREESLPVYLVGGPVRDALLGVPVRDLDFVVEGDAPALARRLAEATDGQVVAHPRFRTATVTSDDARVDFVTARRESYPRPGALPEVSPGNIQTDLDRRDFTINALALPLWEAYPGILDRHGGREDLERGLVRVLHEHSFRDDPTRVLRAIRYEQRLGFSTCGQTLAQMKAALETGYMGAVTGDRVRHELERIFEETDPTPALRRAIQLGVLSGIQPELVSLAALERLVSQVPASLLAGQSLYYLAALVYHLSRPEAGNLIRRLNMPNSWAVVVRDTIELRHMHPALSDPGRSPSEISALLENMSLISVGAVSSISDSREVASRLRHYLEDWRLRRPELTGGDLLALGVPPGPMVGCILRELRRRRIDAAVSSEAEERRLVQDILKRKRSQSTDG